jgi:hypothetical protein
MAKSVFSIIVKCWYDAPGDAARFQVMRTDTDEEVSLGSANLSFLIRLSVDEAAQVERCLIRHIATGREVYVQSALGLRAFITSCLLPDPQ